MNKLYKYQPKGEKDSSALDMIILVALVIVVIFTKSLSGVFSSFPSPYNTICQVLLFAAIVAGLFVLYNRRIAKYRYNIAYAWQSAQENQEDGEEASEPPFNSDENTDLESGTIVFERTVAAKGKVVEIVYKHEVVAILNPGESLSQVSDGGKPVTVPFIRQGVFTTLPKSTAHRLVYKRRGNYYDMLFHPDEKLLSLFEKAGEQ